MEDGEFDGLAVLAKQAKGLKFEYYPTADETLVGTVDRGVLFLMAFWSGSSRISFSRLTELLVKEATEIELVVADVDGCSRTLTELPSFDPPFGGNGETAWIRNGQILATTSGTSGPDFFSESLTKLVAAP